jgi:hypothetical protein
VDRKPSSVGGDGEIALAGEGSVAGYLERERQKQELRRERDGIVLALAKDLGEQGMAERLGVSRGVVEKLLADARARRDREGPADAEPEIVVRRLGVDRERWAEADAHYEALGSAPHDRAEAPAGLRRLVWCEPMLRFASSELSDAELALQGEVREFLARSLPRGSFAPGLGMAAARDQDFSRALAARGWLGMALPRRYGGSERGVVERFIVVEELLRWGAPVRYHWVADRQTGPLILRYGSDAQRERFLPAICRAEVSFSIGMSEPEAGSDLAAVQTRARRADGGWRVSGTKLWTGGAHENDWFVVLCRTSDEDDRHQGLTQMIIDLHADGITVRPIAYLDGSEFFNEVLLDDVFVAEELVLGEVF